MRDTCVAREKHLHGSRATLARLKRGKAVNVSLCISADSIGRRTNGFLPFQKLVAETAAQAVFPVAILFLKLDEGLRIGCCRNGQASSLPHAGDVVVFGTKRLQETGGTVAQYFVGLVQTVGIKERNDRIDEHQVEGIPAYPLLLLGRCPAEGEMLLPIGRSRGGKELFGGFGRLGFHHLREERPVCMVQACQLGQPHMGEVARSEPEETPLTNGQRRRQFELTLQVAELLLKPQVIVVGVCRFFIQQTGLPEEEGFYLKKVVAMLVHGTEGQTLGPRFESVAIQTKAVVACQGDEENVLPMVLTGIEAGTDVARLPFETLYLQGRKPGVHRQAGQRGKDGVAGRIDIGTAQLVVATGHVVGTSQYELGNRTSVAPAYGAVGLGHHVQNDVVVSLIRLMPMLHPLRSLIVNLHIAHPQHAVQLQLGVEEVGTRIGIGQARIDDFHPLSVGGAQFLQGEDFVFPKVV